MSNSHLKHSNNILPDLKTPSTLYSIIGIIVFLIIVLFCLLFKVSNPFSTNLNKSQEELVGDVFIILFFTLIIFVICIILLPNFKEIKSLFEQINNVTYAIIYTIFLILFFTLISPDILNTYAYIITPITILLGIFIFYKSYTNNYVEKFSINYERIKTLILFFCFLTLSILFYNKDPGGLISKYFGYSLLITIITAVFVFLYLIQQINLPIF